MSNATESPGPLGRIVNRLTGQPAPKPAAAAPAPAPTLRQAAERLAGTFRVYAKLKKDLDQALKRERQLKDQVERLASDVEVAASSARLSEMPNLSCQMAEHFDALEVVSARLKQLRTEEQATSEAFLEAVRLFVTAPRGDKSCVGVLTEEEQKAKEKRRLLLEKSKKRAAEEAERRAAEARRREDAAEAERRRLAGY